VSPELAPHLAECAECAAAWQRALTSARLLGELARQSAPEALDEAVRHELTTEAREVRVARALSSLERMEAPSALDGSVVCAINAGHRQDRAAASLVGLTRQAAPNELEDRLLHEPRRQVAPDVLDRLVAEELADPAKAMASRFAGRLPRLKAPAALDRYVESSLQGRPGSDHRAERRLQLPTHRFGPLAAAAGLLAVLWIGRTMLVDPEPTELSFSVSKAETVDDLGPTARSWMTGLAGGILDAGDAR
jgi:hypothetical protein